MRLKLKLLNKGAGAARRVAGKLASRTRGVRVANGSFSVPTLDVGESVETRDLEVELDSAEREVVQLAVDLNGTAYPLEIPVFRKSQPIPDVVVVDGSSNTVWQRAIRQVETKLGAGNGDGNGDWGEEVVVALRDGSALRPVEVLTSDPCVDISGRVSDPWGGYDNVGATAKYTIVQLSSRCKDTRAIPLFIEYQLPNKPEHTLKQGVIALSVRGTDRTPPQVRSARVADWNRLEFLILDGAAVRKATAVLDQGASHIRVPLNDDGRSGDRAPNDRVFSGVAQNPPPGRYAVRVEVEDEFGNSQIQMMAEALEFQLPRATPAIVR